jgi:hypothetical protein
MYTVGGQPYLTQLYPVFRRPQPLMTERVRGNYAPALPVSNPVSFKPSKSEGSTVNLTAHRWPWRLFAFLSDMGLVGHLVRQPKLAKLGLGLSLPYYAYAIASQPDAHAQQEEVLYQATANGLFPYVEAKIGVKAGRMLYRELIATLPKKYARALIRRAAPSMLQSVMGFAALVALTPTVGDPLSRSILKFYREKRTSPQCY